MSTREAIILFLCKNLDLNKKIIIFSNEKK